MKETKIIMMDINKPIPYENNPRINEPAIQAVANSIKEFGFKNPIIVDKNNVIIAGHTRLRAAKKLNLKEVPVIIADDLTEEQVKAFRLADNKTAELAEWDYDMLEEELASIVDLNMEDFGFDYDEINDDDDKEIVEDIVPEEDDIERVSKSGDIWQLGSHRLMVGDSTQTEDVDKLMNGEIADLVITDPPYNVDYVGKTADALKIENDKMDNNSFYEFLFKAFSNMSESIKKGGSIYVFHADTEGINFRNAFKSCGFKLAQCLVWVKNAFVFGRQDYQWKHEPILYGWKEGAAHYFIDDKTQSTVIEDKGIEINKLKKEEMKILLEELLSDKVSTTVIKEDRPFKSTLHPTMKPIKLIARLMKNSSKKNELVLDLFGGSGSTLIAAEQLGRKCYTMEYDPLYADAIIQRWENFTGKKAVLLNNNHKEN